MKKYLLLWIIAAAFLMNCTKKSESPTENTDDLASISGVLVDSAGNPIQGVHVSIDSDSGNSDVTDENGEFKIGDVTPGTHTLTFTHDLFEVTSEIEVDLAGGQEFTLEDDIVVTSTRGLITGKLVDSNGNPIVGAVVRVGEDPVIEATSDSEGEFTLGGVIPGTHTLTIIHERFEDNNNVEVTVTAGEETVVENNIVLSSAFYIIKGLVKKDNGQLITSAGVSIANTILSTQTFEGEFVITDIPKTLNNPILLAARSGIGYNSVTDIEFVDNDTTVIDDIIIEEPGISVAGKVLDEDGLTPKEGVIVQAVGAGLQDTTNANGNYILHNVPDNQDGVLITVPEVDGSTGSVIGINGKVNGFIPGMDIYLHPVEKEVNNMILMTATRVVGDQAENVDLIIFPEVTDDSTEIVTYNWAIKGGASLEETTDPNITVDVETLKDAGVFGAKSNTDSRPVILVTLEVTATNSEGEESATEEFVVQIVTESPEIISIGASTAGDATLQLEVDIQAGEGVFFEAYVSDFGGLESFSWDFGDGLPAIITSDTLPQFSYSFQTAGTYNVVFLVTDLDGQTDSDTIIVNVAASDLPQVDLLSPFDGFVNLSEDDEVEFTWEPVDVPGVKYNVFLDSRISIALNKVTEDPISATKFTAPVDSGVKYYWRVEAVLGNLTSSSLVREVYGRSNIDYRDILLEPGKDSLLETWTVDLVWQHQEGVDNYTVLLGVSANTMADLGDDYYYNYNYSGIENSRYYRKSNLLANRTYVWQVRWTDSNNELQQSELWSFRSPNHEPSAPFPNTPNNITIGADSPITFNWSTSTDTDSDDELSYIIYLDTESPPFTALVKVKDTALTHTTSYTAEYTDTAGISEPGVYFWRVAATDGHDTTFSNSSYDRKITIGSAVNSDILFSPDSGSDVLPNTSLRTRVIWEYETGFTYQVWHGESEDELDSSGNFTTFYVVDDRYYADLDVLGNRMYYWMVKIKDGQGNVTNSNTWTFNTLNQVPSAPGTNQPSSKTIGVGKPITFDWYGSTDRDVEDELDYIIYTGTESPPTEILISVGDTLNHTYADGIDAAGTHYWRVGVTDGRDTILSTTTRTITLADMDSDFLVAPADEANDVPAQSANKVRLSFNYVNGFTYQIFIGTDANSMDSVSDYATYSYLNATQRYTDATASGNSTYFWMIKTKDAQGNITDSPTRTFSTANQVPAAPNASILPGNNSLFRTNQSVTYRWNTVVDSDGDAIEYIIYQQSLNSNPTTILASGITDTTYTVAAGFAASDEKNWRVRAYDGRDTSAYSSNYYFDINDPPYSTNMPADTNLKVGVPYSFTIAGADSNGSQTVSYYIVSGSKGAVNSGSGIFTWTPPLADVGVHQGIVQLRDNGYPSGVPQLYDTLTWNITVDAPTGTWLAASQRNFTGAASTERLAFRGGQPYAAYYVASTGIRVETSTDDFSYSLVGSNNPLEGVARNTVEIEASDTTDSLYVLYQQNASPYSIFVMSYNGTSWDTLGGAAAVPTGYSSSSHDMIVHNDTVYVGYRTTVSPYFARVVRYNGATWEAVGGDISGGGAELIRLASDGTNVYIAHRNSTTDQMEVAYLVSGTSWNIVAGATKPANTVQNLRMDVHGGKVYLAYRELGSPYELSVSSSDNLGAWTNEGPAMFVNSNALGDIKVDDATGDVYVAFEATSNHASVVTLNGGTWDYLGYPGFTQPLGTVSAIRMELKDGNPYIIYDEDQLSPNGGSILKFVP